MLGSVSFEHTEKHLFYYLTPEVRGHVGDMNPTSIALPDELREAYLPLLLHLLDEFEQTTVVGLVARDEVGSAAQEVMAVLRSSDERVEFLTSISTADHYWLAPRLAYGVEQLIY